MIADVINTIGLSADIIGVLLLLRGLFVSEENAIKRGVATLASKTKAENLTLPAVADRLKQSRIAKCALPILVLGFALQIAATWLR